MAREKICGIYKVTNQVNGKVYIGQSVDILDRWKSHKRDAFYKKAPDHDCIFHQAIRKYGIEKFSINILEECAKENLNDLEKFYIKEYKSFTTAHEFGYNMTPGGDKAFNFSDKEKQPQHIPCPICGGLMWKESKCCIKCKSILYITSNSNSKRNTYKISMPAKEDILKSFYELKSCQKIADKYNVSTVLLKKWRKELNLPEKVKDTIELYEREYLGIVKEEKPKRQIRKVLQISLESGEILREFDNCNAAEKFLGIKNGGGVNGCCLGKIKTSYGYRWKYKE